jgi:DeoR/GlpR family transcriptional regulator of sugar metabolism
LKKRQLEIVRQILENQRPVSVQQLMKTYNKSERSIRYDVLEIRDQLNQYGIVLKNISGEGYYIDKNSRLKATKENCYVKQSGYFITQLDAEIITGFKENYSDKTSYIELVDSFLQDMNKITEYSKQIISRLI